MKKWQVVYTKQAEKDAKKIKNGGLKPKVEALIKILQENHFKTPPPYKKLVGDLVGIYSRRINIQHRLVYSIDDNEKAVKVLRLWTHYE